MKQIVGLFVGIFSLVVLKAQTADEKAITQNVQALNAAIFVQKNTAVIDGLLAKEVTYGHSNGKIENRAEMISGVEQDTKIYANVLTEVGNILFQQNTAVVRHVISATQTEKDGKVSPLKLQVLQVWIKDNNQWKLQARQSVRLVN